MLALLRLRVWITPGEAASAMNALERCVLARIILAANEQERLESCINCNLLQLEGISDQCATLFPQLAKVDLR